MSDDAVRDLGQRYLAAAWETSHALTTAENPHRELDELLIAVEEHLDQLNGLRLRLVHEAWALGAGRVLDREKASARTTTAQATAALKLALDLEDRFRHVGQALSDGVVSLAQAEAIVAGLKKLPVTLTRHDLEVAQTTVLGYAGELGPSELRTLASRMVEIIDPAGAEQVEADRLAREERHARATRFLKLRPDHHGSVTITGRLPISDGALLAAQVEALMPPISFYRDTDELPGPEARRADGLVLLAQLAANAGTVPAHGMDRPTVKVTIPLATLTTVHGPAVKLDGGQSVSVGEARRLACDADVIPIVLGARSEILDVGQPHRLFTKGLRTALVTRDQGCAFPHCEVPPAACEAHHIIPWHQGGETKLSNGVLLCPWHHRLVEPDPDQSEHSQWQVHLDPETGRPWFTPPRHVDTTRRPRQHRRFTLDDIVLDGLSLDEHTAATPMETQMVEGPACPRDGTAPCPHRTPAPEKPNPWHAPC
jgi:hypothetical protein